MTQPTPKTKSTQTQWPMNDTVIQLWPTAQFLMSAERKKPSSIWATVNCYTVAYLQFFIFKVWRTGCRCICSSTPASTPWSLWNSLVKSPQVDTEIGLLGANQTKSVTCLRTKKQVWEERPILQGQKILLAYLGVA